MDKSNLYILKYVKAGKAGKVLSLNREMISGIQTQDCLADIKPYLNKADRTKDAFIVIGESMAREGVFAGDLLLVSACTVNELRYGDFLILKVDKNRLEQFFKTNQDLGFKMRKFLLMADMTTSIDDLFEQVKRIDETSRYLDIAEEIFKKKFQKAKDELNGENKTLLSVTYTENGMDYSFHTFTDLYAKVDHVYRKECGQYEEVSIR